MSRFVNTLKQTLRILLLLVKSHFQKGYQINQKSGAHAQRKGIKVRIHSSKKLKKQQQGNL